MDEAAAGRLELQPWCRGVLKPLGQKPARHHKALLGELQRLAGPRGPDRLMVLMPPGSAKSTYASLLFPAWWFTRHRRSAVIAASHTAELAAHFGRGLRNLVAEHTGTLGYGLAKDNHAAHRFRTSAGGEYFATGVEGPVTGRRADLVVIDDPIKSHAEADSAQARDRLWDWYRSELVTRLKPGGRIVLVMTRWHEDDLGGRLLASGDAWTTLRLPALAEADDPLRRAAGEALWPQWEDATALARKRETVGNRVWQALYQQAPTSPAGLLFPAHRIGVVDAVPAGLRAVRAWDLAATAAVAGRDPDWTVGVKLARHPDGRLFVLDVVRLRAGPNEVAQAILATAGQDGAGVAIGLPQDPGQAGKVQVAWLATMLAGYRVVASAETGAKATRATPVAAQVEAGNLAVLRGGWNKDFIEELREFPQGRKDDQVDALARAHGMLAVQAAPARRVSLSFLAR
jgi:predicted phage terminase large subunit-like protein